MTTRSIHKKSQNWAQNIPKKQNAICQNIANKTNLKDWQVVQSNKGDRY
ncbi:MAG: hypothetical protein K5793_02040 [Nitrosarchaeum sp.]|nr:hypothetical protein [Nitrosarchaeum sp.]